MAPVTATLVTDVATGTLALAADGSFDYTPPPSFEGEVTFTYETSDGTVCYFGEDVEFFEDGELVNRGGSWRAGVDGALPGIIMPASPAPGPQALGNAVLPAQQRLGQHGLLLRTDPQAARTRDSPAAKRFSARCRAPCPTRLVSASGNPT